jgi:diguanylate cyclase (GGDEF)-like protein
LVLLAGITSSVVVSLVWRHTVNEQNQRAFDATTTNVQNVVSTQVARQDDLLATMKGLVTTDPQMSNAFLLGWYKGADVHERFPGGIGVSYVERVPAADLAAFALRAEADPVTGLAHSSPFTVFPDAPANEYCLQHLGVFETDRVQDFVIPAGLDYCAAELPGQGSSPVPATLDLATVTGAPSVILVGILGTNLLGEYSPIYAGGVIPDTIDRRRDAVIGWVSASFDARMLVEPAVAGVPNLRVNVFNTTPSGPTSIATSGQLGSGTVSTVTLPASTDGSWVVQVSQVVGAGSLSANAQALWVLIVGTIISALVFVLTRLLAGSRERALRMVHDKTEELEFQALHDELTGLPNRALLLDRATQMLARQSRARSNVAALFIDLDNFKTINDTLGHAAGDDYLRAVASRIDAVLRDSDTVGRLGGDEFIVLVEDPSAVGGPEMVAQRILDIMSEPIVVDEVTTPVSCSIGIAHGTRESAEALFHDADLAMYQAKVAGKSGFAVFVPEMQDAVEDRVNLEWELRGALERDELFLLYQPTFDLHTGTTTGVEALLRWNHPTRGVVSPMEFIPVAEETNLIIPIGRWVLDTASVQGAVWAAEGHPIRVAVNVSGRQLDRDAFVDEVSEALLSSGLDPDRLTLEITETTLMRDAGETQRRLHDLKALGVHLAIDDFGTGYSSMAYLQQFPVDAIKIDRSFIAGIAESNESHALIRTLIQLGKTLHLETLAEGIEDDGQLDELIREDCDTGQGFLYARPLTVEALSQFLAQHTTAVTTSTPSVTTSTTSVAP